MATADWEETMAFEWTAPIVVAVDVVLTAVLITDNVAAVTLGSFVRLITTFPLVTKPLKCAGTLIVLEGRPPLTTLSIAL